MDVLDQCQTVIIQLPSKSIVYEWLFTIHDFYRPIHTYVSIMLCLLGTLCNFCNIVVLTRKQMRTPVNMILTAMACCDTVVLFSNLIYTTHYTFVAFANCHPKHWSYGWAMFLIAHAHLSLVGHSSSVWLSVMLAFIRYMTLRRRGKMTGIQIELRHAYIAIAAVVVFVSVMNAPNFLTYKIMELSLNQTCEIKDASIQWASAYVPGVSDMAVEADCLVFRMAFWISGTVFKMLPCVLLTLLVSLLTRILNEVKANRQRLLLRGASSSAAVAGDASAAGAYIGGVSGAHEFSNIVSSAATTMNLNTVAPAPHTFFRPAFNGTIHVSPADHDALIMDDSGARRHSSYDTLPPKTPTADGGVTPPPPSPASATKFAAPLVIHASITRQNVPLKTDGPHAALIRSNSAKAAVNALTSARLTASSSGGGGGGARADRTTRMLLTIVCVFLITEFPQGIMALLSGFFSEEFRRYIYNNVGDILDLLSLCEACTSFIIYCSMSGQFRNEFRRVFVPTQLRRWLAENASCGALRGASGIGGCGTDTSYAFYAMGAGSDTYADASRGCGAATPATGGDSTCDTTTTTTTRPASSLGVLGAGGGRPATPNSDAQQQRARTFTPLLSERRAGASGGCDRRAVTINFGAQQDSSLGSAFAGVYQPHSHHFLNHLSYTGDATIAYRSASPSLAIVNEDDVEDTQVSGSDPCSLGSLQSPADDLSKSSKPIEPPAFSIIPELRLERDGPCESPPFDKKLSNQHTANSGTIIGSNYREVYQLNSHISPDIPLIVCSDWSDDAASECGPRCPANLTEPNGSCESDKPFFEGLIGRDDFQRRNESSNGVQSSRRGFSAKLRSNTVPTRWDLANKSSNFTTGSFQEKSSRIRSMRFRDAENCNNGPALNGARDVAHNDCNGVQYRRLVNHDDCDNLERGKNCALSYDREVDSAVEEEEEFNEERDLLRRHASLDEDRENRDKRSANRGDIYRSCNRNNTVPNKSLKTVSCTPNNTVSVSEL